MRHRTLLGFGLIGILAAGCSSASDDTTPKLPNDSCAAAMGRLDECVSTYCQSSDDAICDALQTGRSGSLFGSSTGSCDAMAAADLDHLTQASCDDIINEARLLAAGKADFPCPTYFPWCNSLTPKGADYHVNVLSFDQGQAQLEVLLPDIARTIETHNGLAFHALHLAGAGTTQEVGRPSVPVISFLLGLPAGTDQAWIDAYQVIDQATAKRVRLMPVQHSVLEDAPNPDFAFDSSFYTQDTTYPSTQYAIDNVSTWRNYRVVRVTVNPLQFNPAKSELSVASRVQLTVRFADNHNEPKDTVDDGESTYASSYGTGLVNYPETKAASGNTKDDPARVRYLVIAHDPLIASLQPLLDQKVTQGIVTEVVKLSEVGADPVKIKERINKAYQDSAIEYVLLVGDVADLPMYKYPPANTYGDEIPSDYWYGLLAGDDLLSEVAVGRISAKTPEEVAIHVGKTVAYEALDTQAEWRRRILLVTHEQDYPKKYTECAESVRAKRYKEGMVDFQKLYGGEHATTQQLIDALNAGVGVVSYRGHGSETAWSEWNGEDFGGSNAALTNGAMTPVVFSIACLNSALQHDSPTNAEQWVLRPEGGAVAFFGATLPSWTIPNHDFMRYLFQGLLDEGITQIGPLSNRARAALLAQYGNKPEGTDNAEMYVWLGDPALDLGKTFNLKPEVRVGWCNLQWPAASTVTKGSETENIYAQVWIRGITDQVGQGQGIEGAIGFGPANSDPTKEGWTWLPTTFNVDKGGNDEYVAKLLPPEVGTYAVAARFRGATDDSWIACDLDGSQNGIDPAKLGTLTVQDPTPPNN